MRWRECWTQTAESLRKVGQCCTAGVFNIVSESEKISVRVCVYGAPEYLIFINAYVLVSNIICTKKML